MQGMESMASELVRTKTAPLKLLKVFPLSSIYHIIFLECRTCMLIFEMRQEVCHILLPQTILVIFKSNLGEFN